jgi:hypothetical protein
VLRGKNVKQISPGGGPLIDLIFQMPFFKVHSATDCEEKPGPLDII